MKTVRNLIPYIPILGIILVFFMENDEYYPLNNNFISFTSAIVQGITITYLLTKFVF